VCALAATFIDAHGGESITNRLRADSPRRVGQKQV
jgi:hypothetical protein